MALPNSSNSLYVARLRYVQSAREPIERQNPDALVGRFLSLRDRLRTAWLSPKGLSKLRADPFYYYLLARTRHYDRIVEEAVGDGVRAVLSVGCGADTRAYRFQPLLRDNGVRVLECDQPVAIRAKQRLVKRWGCSDYVEHLPLDLNDRAWPALRRWLDARAGARCLVLMEGVSVYVEQGAFSGFLRFLGAALPPGSHVAYDYKLRGADDDFGRGGRTRVPFRLPAAAAQVEAFHDARGLRVLQLEPSADLGARLLTGLTPESPGFGEDALLRLEPREIRP